MVGEVELVEQIGSHATGTLWAARHVASGQEVAVKFASRAALDADETLVERFRLESRAIGEIDSPHVVRVFDDGITDEGLPYVVVERLDGERLSRRLAREGQLPLPDVEQLVSQTARGLGAAHAVGIVHRDVQPDNLLLVPGTPTFTVKIVDFGLAKVIGGNLRDPNLTQHGKLIGTPQYLSPERASARKATPSADMWGLSVVAYLALTGALPFDDPKLGLTLVRIIQGDFTPPASLRPGLSSDTDAFFRRAFAPDPGKRFATVSELAQQFSASLPAGEEELDWSL